MKHFTVLYTDAKGTPRRWDGSGIDAPDAFQRMRSDLGIESGTIEVHHQIEHRVPRITVQVDGNVLASYSDSEVDLLVIDGHNDSVLDAAVAQEADFMPFNRQAEKLAYVMDDAFLFHKPTIDHRPDSISFDFDFIADSKRVNEFTLKVWRDAEDESAG